MTILKKEKLLLFLIMLVKKIIVRKKIAPYKIEEIELFDFLSFIFKDLCCESFVTIQCILRNKIKGATLVNTYTLTFGIIYGSL